MVSFDATGGSATLGFVLRMVAGLQVAAHLPGEPAEQHRQHDQQDAERPQDR